MHCPHYGSGKCCVCFLIHSLWWQTRARFQTTPCASDRPAVKVLVSFKHHVTLHSQHHRKHIFECFRAGSSLRGESLVSGQCALVGEEVRRGRCGNLKAAGRKRKSCWAFGISKVGVDDSAVGSLEETLAKRGGKAAKLTSHPFNHTPEDSCPTSPLRVWLFFFPFQVKTSNDPWTPSLPSSPEHSVTLTHQQANEVVWPLSALNLLFFLRTSRT